MQFWAVTAAIATEPAITAIWWPWPGETPMPSVRPPPEEPMFALCDGPGDIPV